VRPDGDDQLCALLERQQQRNVLADPRRRDRRVRQLEAVEPRGSRRGAVAVGVDDQLGAAAKRAVGDRIHVADDHVRLHPRGSASAPPSTPMSTGLKSRT
jgi:hypothetical protein